MNNLKHPTLTILVSSTDSYKDLWDNFFFCKDKYWHKCPFKTVLVNNEEKPNISEVNIINCGNNASWSERMRFALSQIDSDYICFFLEDFFISDYVDNERIFTALKFMKNNDIKYYKLLNLSPIKTPTYKNFDYLHIIPGNHPYGISLMSGIWNRKYFLDIIGNENYNPWRFEADRLKEEQECNCNEIVGVYDDRNILNITHMVVQGKYLPAAVKKLRKKGIDISLENRPIMTTQSFILHKIKVFVGLKMRKYPILKVLFAPIVKKYSVAYTNTKNT